MGKRGPAPAPTALKLVRGERKDRLPKGEPIPDESGVVPPAWLTDGALEVWSCYAPDLIAKHVLTAWDVDAFARWCDAVERHVRAARVLDREGEVVEAPVFNRNGEQTGHRIVRSEWWAVWKDTNEVIARGAARFGLTPSDRAQLSIGGQEAEDRAERLLS